MYESNSRPNITLAVYDDKINNVELFKKEIEDFAKTLCPFKLNLLNIGVFNTKEGVVFLQPKVTRELLDIHEEFHRIMESFLEAEWRYYLPDLWVPHCTMAIDLNKEKLLQSVEVTSEMFKPMEVSIQGVGIVRFKPVEHISSYLL
jgi:2'-5' RNA ligase